MADWNNLAREINENNHRWWHDKEGNKLERNRNELLMLVVSEISEAMEGERKDLWDDHLPHRKMAEVELADTLIRILDFAGGYGIEISDHDGTHVMFDSSKHKPELLMAIVSDVSFLFDDLYEDEDSDSIRYVINDIMKYAEFFGYDVLSAMEEKLQYNKNRKDHTYEAREQENGKKF